MRWPADCFEDGHPHFTSPLLNERAKIYEKHGVSGDEQKPSRKERQRRFLTRMAFSLRYSCASRSSSASTCHLCVHHIFRSCNINLK